MGCEDVSTTYEELRRRNIERNEKMMLSLGLCLTRGGAPHEVKAPQSCKRRTFFGNSCIKPRRSARLASYVKTTLTSEDLSLNETAQTSSVLRNTKGKETKRVRDGEWQDNTESKVSKGRALKGDKEEHRNMDEDFCTTDSSESEYQVEFNNFAEDVDLRMKKGEGSVTPQEDVQRTASALCLDSLKTMTPAAFGTTFQELIIRALMQSTSSSSSPSPSIQSLPEGEPAQDALVSNGDCSVPSSWKEAAYNRATAQLKRKPPMTRTSAGEESDSQEEFPIPENESPQARSLRYRRLNRSRARKAKDLTTNRKAMKKVPNVIYIDGTGRAKGIHRHLWRAAVRGQCGRLDPTMDNINHHPKHVVDSIWHAPEKEWEFEGFAHRAREMFERSATKFMRNRKMQLKTKCKKNVDAPKPDDVNDVHWKKIVHLTKESSKQAMSTGFRHSGGEGKQKNLEVLQERSEYMQRFQGSCTNTGSQSPSRLMTANDSDLPHEENVDARIKNLRNELLRLENSMKFRNLSKDEADKEKAIGKDKVVSLSDVNRDIHKMKENIIPLTLNGDVSSELNMGTNTRKGVQEVDRNLSSAVVKNKSPSVVHVQPVVMGVQGGQNSTGMEEVECGDVVSLLAVDEGRREEIGKAIVMGLAGSKYARKVIPKGWHLVKVYTYTSAGASEVCPFPSGWADQVKHKTIKDAEGRNILWPDSFMHM